MVGVGNVATSTTEEDEDVDEDVESRETHSDPSLADKVESLDLHDPITSQPDQSHDDVQNPHTPPPVFQVAHIGVDRRMLVNRQRRLKMYRCWMQAVFRKAGAESEVPTSTLRVVEKEGEGEKTEEAEGEDTR